MPASPRSARSLLALLLFAIAIAVASAGVVVARQARPTVVPAAPDGAGAVRSEISAPASVATASGVDTSSAADLRREHALVPVTTSAAAVGSLTGRAAANAPQAKAKVASKGAGASGSAAGLTGRNRMWLPALGIRRSTSFFACSSNAYPGNRVYRWGCAGRNNVYLFGHAYSVFMPLHDAYVRGRLKKGMKAFYADSRGHVSTYKVIWWRITTPDRGGFAYAAQSRPSMTLQTCVGARSQYRLIVRLVKVG